jgi:hypothetical protein
MWEGEGKVKAVSERKVAVSMDSTYLKSPLQAYDWIVWCLGGNDAQGVGVMSEDTIEHPHARGRPAWAWALLRTYCFYKSNTTYQGILSGLGRDDAKGDLEDEKKAH